MFNNMEELYVFVGKVVVYEITADLVIKGFKFTTKEVKKILKNRAEAKTKIA